MDHTTISRWRNAGRAPAEGVIAIARAYRTDPIDGLIAAGYLNESEVLGRGVRDAVRRAPTLFLTEELHERGVTGRLDSRFDRHRANLRPRPDDRQAT